MHQLRAMKVDDVTLRQSLRFVSCVEVPDLDV